jgi:hypothetical protein
MELDQKKPEKVNYNTWLLALENDLRKTSVSDHSELLQSSLPTKLVLHHAETNLTQKSPSWQTILK